MTCQLEAQRGECGAGVSWCCVVIGSGDPGVQAAVGEDGVFDSNAENVNAENVGLIAGEGGCKSLGYGYGIRIAIHVRAGTVVWKGFPFRLASWHQHPCRGARHLVRFHCASSSLPPAPVCTSSHVDTSAATPVPLLLGDACVFMYGATFVSRISPTLRGGPPAHVGGYRGNVPGGLGGSYGPRTLL